VLYLCSCVCYRSSLLLLLCFCYCQLEHLLYSFLSSTTDFTTPMQQKLSQQELCSAAMLTDAVSYCKHAKVRSQAHSVRLTTCNVRSYAPVVPGCSSTCLYSCSHSAHSWHHNTVVAAHSWPMLSGKTRNITALCCCNRCYGSHD
jgi:hypothetical protein